MNKFEYDQIDVLQRKTMAIAHFLNYLLLKYSFKGADIIGSLISKLLIREPKGSVVCPTIFGYSFIVNPVIDKGIEKSIYFCGSYEMGTIYFLKKVLRENDIYLDVGANIGVLCIAASKFVGRNGKVYAFEPEMEMFSILQENVKLNRLENIYCYNIACGSSKQKMLIYKNLVVNRGSASLIKPQGDSSGVEVLVETLDDFVQTKHIGDVRMVKIDVEGWELEVLKGAKALLSRSKAPIICIEYSHLHQVHNGRLQDIYNYLLNINYYRIFRLKKGKGNPSKLIKIQGESDLPYHDNLFCFLPFHLESLPKGMFE